MVHEITAELNDEEFEKYQILQENNMTIGELIDLIFYLRDKYGVRNNQLLEDRIAELVDKKKSLEEEMENSDKDYNEELDRINRELNVIERIQDDSIDYDAKMKILEKEYTANDDTYDMKVQSLKRGVKWSKFFESL